jgi:hypothetical protein
LKKRSKKLLGVGSRLTGSVRRGSEVFWFFFSKKNSSFSSHLSDVKLSGNAAQLSWISHHVSVTAGKFALQFSRLARSRSAF